MSISRICGLSTAIFEAPHTSLLSSDISHVEISSHRPESLEHIIARIKEQRIIVMGVHGPAPNRTGNHINIACTPTEFERTYRIIKETFRTAEEVGAQIVTFHPFYDLNETTLPTDDERKFPFLRDLQPQHLLFKGYLDSDNYLRAKARAITNLKIIVQRLDQEFPRNILLCLENLNPRITYGLQIPSEVIEIYEDVGNKRIALDLDLPHAYLSAKAHNFNLLEEVQRVAPYVAVVSLSQNHGGVYCVDRRFDEAQPRTTLQDVDPHFPVHGSVERVTRIDSTNVSAENLAFVSYLQGAVVFTKTGSLPTGTIPIKECLALLPQKPVILEYDNRYAPLPFLLSSYHRFKEECSII